MQSQMSPSLLKSICPLYNCEVAKSSSEAEHRLDLKAL